MDNSVLPLKAVILEISKLYFNRFNQVSTFILKKTLHANLRQYFGSRIRGNLKGDNWNGITIPIF
jgi:hypothetical protein